MIRNKTKNTIISENYSNKNTFGKIRGLIGKKTPETIMLKTRFGIHTLLLKFPIDILIIDKDKKVVRLKKHLSPNRVFFWNLKFDTVIELPDNSLKKSKTEINDYLEIT